MNRLSDELFFPRYHSVDRLLRQVADGGTDRQGGG